MNRLWKWTAIAGSGAALVVFRAITQRLAILHGMLTEEPWLTGTTDEPPPQAADTATPSPGMRAAG